MSSFVFLLAHLLCSKFIELLSLFGIRMFAVLLIVVIASGHCRPISDLSKNGLFDKRNDLIEVGIYFSNDSFVAYELNNGTISSGMYFAFLETCDNLIFRIYLLCDSVLFSVELKEEIPFELYLAAVISAVVVLAIMVSFGITCYYRGLKNQMQEIYAEAGWNCSKDFDGNQQVSLPI